VTGTIFRRLQGKSTRLALSYLAIIVGLSLSFSIAFYRTSLSAFPDLATTSAPIKAPDDSVFVSQLEEELQRNIDVFQQKATSLRSELRIRLVVFNIAVVVCGGALSFYLARRTLRPVEAAAEAQGRFASDASHEMRTPLAVVKARNEVALRQPDLTLAKAKQVIQDGTDQILKLETLVDRLLRLSRDDQVAKESFSLQEVATEAMNQSIAAAQVRSMTIKETVPNIQVMGEAPSLAQAIAILLDNAIKYGRASQTIYLEGGSEGRYAWLRVRDEGPGIAPKDLPYIFDRFYRADRSRSKQQESGYGLGLSIAQKLIIQNDGAITVRSNQGEGTTFTVRLRIA
jgi:two-component system, OmpR family, sensor histidine kinase CiaH